MVNPQHAAIEPVPTAGIAMLRPPAPPARRARRHRWLSWSFVLFVAMPSLLGGGYLYTRAADQYASTVAFSVRREEAPSPVELLGGIANFVSAGASEADILDAFIESQEMVRAVDADLGLSEIYGRAEDDPVFGLAPGGAIEDLHAYWQRMVRVVYDPGTGLIEVRALAFAAEDARAVATAIYEESARLIEELSRVAQEDTTDFARAELDRAVARLKTARERLTAFRSRTQIVDPTADLQGQMGLLSTLERQLAEALIDADLLRESTREGDPRLRQADRRIAVIEARIAGERRKLGVGASGEAGGDYATLLAEYERLAVDRQFAEETYAAALAAYDQAQAEARRKSRYLAAHIRPTLAETPQYPRRVILLGMMIFFLTAVWSIGVLAYYSLRDRR